ncbi:MAG: amino acid permease [Hyphomonadaceae bacterium]|nr:MAG: basic amino acid/polyamine antiporter APA family [Caulobacteraceae bacterium]MBT9445251.1 amino acid permease [Hyphomonadaceae bacterium]TPW07952.1 MAG: basic amino acid/polyamine antiporter, APA family [Alphaproteobacteria bacterium]
MSFLTRRPSLDALSNTEEGEHRLRRTLSWPHLVALGVGAIIGTGIYTLIGVGAGLAGPGVMLSFLLAGAVCVFAALAYAELASMMPAAGSAYTYSYAALGEFVAWIVGFSLLLEYSVVCSAVAVGWSGYATGFLDGLGVHLPDALTKGPHAGGIFNFPAVFIIAVVAGLLAIGTRESAAVNAFLVVVKLAALALFVAIALPAFNPAHFEPFMPFGVSSTKVVDGEIVKIGVLPAASIIFFAFYGFDAVSTAAEEAKRPERDLALGIIGSMVICTAIYMIVAAAAIGAMPFGQLAASKEPLAEVVRTLGNPTAAAAIAGAAVIALPTVILAFMYGQSRIFFVMARDGLLPTSLAKVHKRTGSPLAMTFATAIFVGAIAGFFPLDEIAALANAGTLAAFIAVGASLMVLRMRDPARARPFRTPLWFIVGPAAILGCGYLFFTLPTNTQVYFVIAHAIGLVLYFAWGFRKSRLAAAK